MIRQKHFVFLAAISTFVFYISFQPDPAHALDYPPEKIPTIYELKGLVLDKTITPPGHKFYKKFARVWWDKNIELPGNLIIQERPNPLKGSLIIIRFKRRVLFSTIVSPARSAIEKKANIAINTVKKRAQVMLIEKLFENNPDIDSFDEI